MGRLEAIKQNTEITRFYACSKDRYNTLTREEKNFVKAFKQKVKLRRDRMLQQKKLERGQKRRKSAYPVMMQTGNSEVTNKTSTDLPSVNAHATEMITTAENNNNLNSLDSIPEAKR